MRAETLNPKIFVRRGNLEKSSNSWSRASIFALFWILLISVGWPREDESPDLSDFEATLFKKLTPEGMGVAILVARQGKVLFYRCYGLADREKHVPTTLETKFRIGSLTKQFTAAAILRLSEQKRLSIEDPLSKYFPTFPRGNIITLHQLLNHTSGIHDYTAHPDFMERVIHPISSGELVSYFQNDPPDFAPGEQFEYCNTGYVLLGQIVEKVSGQKLNDFFGKEFFEPLEMQNTSLFFNANPPSEAAKGYSFSEGTFRPAVDWDMSWAGGAGGLYSTVADLSRWTTALQTGQVLKAPQLHLMLQEGTALKKESLTRYGMGLSHSELGWLPVVGHNGGLNGFQSYLLWFPDVQTSIVVLENAAPAPPAEDSDNLLSFCAHAFLAAEMIAHAPKPDTTINPKVYADYVGQYDYRSAVQEISTENGHLFAQLSGQPKFEILPTSADRYFYRAIEARLTFDRDSSGVVIGITHAQNGHTFSAPKIRQTDSPVLSTAQLDEITGQYQYGPQEVLTITRRNNQLFAQLTGLPEYPIFPKSDHEFYWKVVAATVEFVRGPNGKITSAIHHQNGQTLTAPRLGGN